MTSSTALTPPSPETTACWPKCWVQGDTGKTPNAAIPCSLGDTWHVAQTRTNPQNQLLRPRFNMATVVQDMPPHRHKSPVTLCCPVASTLKISSRWVSKLFKIEPSPSKTSECTEQEKLLSSSRPGAGRELPGGRVPLGSGSPMTAWGCPTKPGFEERCDPESGPV